jgi:hypothetical protein
MIWIAYLVGGFYLLGGLVALRQARMNLFLDKALAAISLEPTAREDRIAGAWMLGASVLTVASGATLVLRSRWAVAAFGLCWLAQAVYLLWATRTRDYGRQATINAFALYTAATLLVVWMERTEILN